MHVITRNPIVYSNASGLTEKAYYSKLKSACGDPPGGGLAFKKKKKYKECRDKFMSSNSMKSQDTKQSSTGTVKQKPEKKPTTDTQKPTENTQTDTTNKGKKLLLIGGGVLLLVVVGMVILKRRNN
jgi:hypothetical protein